MKSIMLSIKPKYCELIANGKKTIEVRKTRPKAEPPFKCYIYCTKAKNIYDLLWTEKEGVGVINRHANGKVIGEFICDEVSKFTAEFTDGETYEDIRLCYSDEFEEEERIIVSNEWENPDNSWVCKESCLSFDDFINYIGANFHDIPFYGWHISNLVIYDKAKTLEDFAMNRPPQSWCYVEELGEKNEDEIDRR